FQPLEKFVMKKPFKSLHLNQLRISLTSAAQLDPVQKLFLEKIREYSTKSQAYGGPVDAGPEYETAFSEELNKLQRLYGSGDLTEFPEFKFSEPGVPEID
uniref:ATP synthase peripheral stalk subunit F6, mitochondrial n=1 Tax=Cyprinus carpio TaxID=7962 RepID=A0A8C2DVE5_CYPCA